MNPPIEVPGLAHLAPRCLAVAPRLGKPLLGWYLGFAAFGVQRLKGFKLYYKVCAIWA